MTEQPSEDQGSVDLFFEGETAFSVAPGGTIAIPVTMINQGSSEAYFELTVIGLPAVWISMPPSVIHLAPGQRRVISINVKPSAPPNSHPGRYPFTVRITNQQDEERSAEVEGNLTVAAFEVKGRIGVLMESTHYAVAPGESVTMSFVLINQGVVDDYLGISLEGISANWISSPSAMNFLTPGEEKEVSITINPPRSSKSLAGRHRVNLQVTSREAPGEIVEVSCILTLGAFTEYTSELRPEEFDAGQPALVTVENQGNVQESFTISWQSQNEELLFEVVQPQPPGVDEYGQPAQPPEKVFAPVESQNLRVPAGHVDSMPK